MALHGERWCRMYRTGSLFSCYKYYCYGPLVRSSNNTNMLNLHFLKTFLFFFLHLMRVSQVKGLLMWYELYICTEATIKVNKEKDQFNVNSVYSRYLHTDSSVTSYYEWSVRAEFVASNPLKKTTYFQVVHICSCTAGFVEGITQSKKTEYIFYRG